MDLTNSKQPRTLAHTQQHKLQTIFTDLEASKLHFQQRAPYIARKNQPRTKAREDLPFQQRFRMTYKELLSMPEMEDKSRF